MICKSCGNLLSDEAKFCTECGANTDTEAETAVTADNEISSEKTTETETAPETAVEAVEDVTEEAAAAVVEEEKKAPEKDEAAAVITENTAKPEAAAAVTEEAPKAPEAEGKKPVKVGAGRIFGASLVSILAIVFIVVSGLLLSAKIGLNGNVLKNRAEDANLAVILDADVNDETTAAEYIYNNIGSAILGKKDIQPKDLRGFLIAADFEDFAAEKIEAYADYIIDGKSGNPSASSEDFVQFFRDNEDVAREEFDKPFSESDYKNMTVRLENRGLNKALDVNEWSDKLGFNAKNLSYVFSYLTMGIAAAVALFMLVWIAIIVDKKARHLTGFYGNIALISGLVMFVPSAAFLAGASNVALSTNTLAAFLAAELLVPFALVMLCTGAFGIVLGIIFKRIKKFIKKKAASK